MMVGKTPTIQQTLAAAASEYWRHQTVNGGIPWDTWVNHFDNTLLDSAEDIEKEETSLHEYTMN